MENTKQAQGGLTEVSIETVITQIKETHRAGEEKLTEKQRQLINEVFQKRTSYGSGSQYLYLPTFEIIGNKEVKSLVDWLCKNGLAHYNKNSGCSFSYVPKFFNGK